MKKFVIITALTILVLLLAVPVSMGGDSFYAKGSGVLYCESDTLCLHEIGHMMDDDLGYPSRSDEFSTAVLLYMYNSIKYSPELLPEPFTSAILAQPGMIAYSKDYTLLGVERFSSPQEELYANLYLLADGNIDIMPEIFRSFYSREAKYTELYDCLTSAPVKLCGAALHIEKR
ncbi:MAG: hypothetical protein EHM33_01930 [Chloroflexi bacterium]|nr:MAG: hypothetical protein EHM33_01930 [Chloroflexota bacterium]